MFKLKANRVESSRAAVKLCRGKSTICSAKPSDGASGRPEEPKEFVFTLTADTSELSEAVINGICSAPTAKPTPTTQSNPPAEASHLDSARMLATIHMHFPSGHMSTYTHAGPEPFGTPRCLGVFSLSNKN